MDRVPTQPEATAPLGTDGAPSRRKTRSKTAMERALGLIALRDRAEGELRQRLLKAGHFGPEVDAAIERLRALGYLDDAKFAAGRARALARSGKLGARAIAQKLCAHGIPRDAAAREARAAMGEGDEVESAKQLVERRFPGLGSAPSTDVKLAARAARFLIRRGFSSAVVDRVLGRVLGRSVRVEEE